MFQYHTGNDDPSIAF